MRVVRLGRSKTLALAALVLALTLMGSTFARAASYRLTYLTTDQPGKAPNTDANLINPWGISFSSTGDFWVANNNTGTSTLYNSTGVPQPLVVTIPSAAGGSVKGTPTGTVFNSTTDFSITQSGKTAPAS